MKYEESFLDKKTKKEYLKFIQETDKCVKEGKGRFLIEIKLSNIIDVDDKKVKRGAEICKSIMIQHKMMNKTGLEKGFLLMSLNNLKEMYDMVITREIRNKEKWPFIEEDIKNPDKKEAMEEFMKRSYEENKKESIEILEKLRSVI